MTPEQRREVEVLADGLCGAEDQRAREALWATLAQVDALTRDKAQAERNLAYMEQRRQDAREWVSALQVDNAALTARAEAAERERDIAQGAIQSVLKWENVSKAVRRELEAALAPSPAVPVDVAKEERPRCEECNDKPGRVGCRACMRLEGP